MLVELDPAIGRAEPDAEIQDLLLASKGTTSGSTSCPAHCPSHRRLGRDRRPRLRRDLVWLDALVTNVDRTAQNPNLLWWHRRIWLIDHGAALYWHHSPDRRPDPLSRFEPVRDHVLLPFASSIAEADARLCPQVTEGLLKQVMSAVPRGWLDNDASVYIDYLRTRLSTPRGFVEEADNDRG